MNTHVYLQNVSYRDGHRLLLDAVSWSITAGSLWTVLGPNGSGKTLLAQIITGRRAPSSGSVTYASGLKPEIHIGYISFEEQETVLERERRRDESWLLHGEADPGTSVDTLLKECSSCDAHEFTQLINRFSLEHLLQRGIKYLSTGELRKVLLCRSLLSHPALLLLDEPYDGLDRASRKQLESMIHELPSQGVSIVMLLNHRDEIPPASTGLICLEDGAVRYLGDPSGYLPKPGKGTEKAPIPPSLVRSTPTQTSISQKVIEMHGVRLSYGEKRVLKDVTWTVNEHEHWMITGPNGSGKSTLLSLVSGDNPKAYGQNLFLFGRKRGSGETVWDIKKQIGFVSGDFQFSYRVRIKALEVIVSGFFDSIGLYTQPTGYQLETALEWISLLGLEKKKHDRLSKLSFGEQRMLLIARAMVKQPRLLIADEPCQGIDDSNREMVLSLLESIARSGETQLLYVTHNPAETLSCIHRILELVPDHLEGSTAVISSPA